jgi:NAD(P)-dependent dehydrogenase (short-subunit alcohol dehydrogenase family)
MARTAVVTGGAGGMGLATAKILGRDHHIVVADITQARVDAAVAELSAEGISATGAVCNVTDRRSVAALFACAGESGHVRAVVHTAGVSPQTGSAEFIIKVNAVGTVNIADAFLAGATEGDVLVNVASIAGHLSPGITQPKRAYRLAMSDVEKFEHKLVAATNLMPKKARPGAAYSTSKAFVIWYSQHMAAAFGAKGARILSVSPGSFDTAMGRLEENAGAGKMVEFAALKRFGKPEEIAELLAFCASDKVGYLTGTDILIDGGNKAGMRMRDMIGMMRGAT